MREKQEALADIICEYPYMKKIKNNFLVMLLTL